MVDEAVGGVVVVSTTGATTSLTATNGAADQSRNAVLRIEGTLGSNSTIVIPSVEKLYVVDNQTTGGTYTVKLKTAATTTNVIAPRGGSKFIYCDGVNVHNSVDPVGCQCFIYRRWCCWSYHGRWYGISYSCRFNKSYHNKY